MMHKSAFLALAALCAVTMTPVVLTAAPSAATAEKQKMIARKAKLDDLKSKGLIGETNTGCVAAVPGAAALDPASAALLESENTGRKKIYAAIAAQQKTTAEKVALRRVKQIRNHAKPGEWLQDDAGKWMKK